MSRSTEALGSLNEISHAWEISMTFISHAWERWPSALPLGSPPGRTGINTQPEGPVIRPFAVSGVNKFNREDHMGIQR